MQIVGIKRKVFDLMKIFNIFKKKDEISDFWYEAGSRFDVRSRYFYVPNTDLKINITASDALRIIHEYKTFKYWDAQDIFSRGFWESNLDAYIIDDFINYHKKGLFDYAIAWICDNDIECHDKDKFEYLSNHSKFKVNGDLTHDKKKFNYKYNPGKHYFYHQGNEIELDISAKTLLLIIDLYKKSGKEKLYENISLENNLSKVTIQKVIEEYELGFFDEVIIWICDNDIESNGKDKLDYLYNKDLISYIKNYNTPQKSEVMDKRIDRIAHNLIGSTPNASIDEMIGNHVFIFGDNVDLNKLRSALERLSNKEPAQISELDYRNNLRELIEFENKISHYHFINDGKIYVGGKRVVFDTIKQYFMNDQDLHRLTSDFKRCLIKCGCVHGNHIAKGLKIQDKYGISPFLKDGRYLLSKKHLPIDEILVIFSIMLTIDNYSKSSYTFEYAIWDDTIKNFLECIEHELSFS